MRWGRSGQGACLARVRTWIWIPRTHVKLAVWYCMSIILGLLLWDRRLRNGIHRSSKTRWSGTQRDKQGTVLNKEALWPLYTWHGTYITNRIYMHKHPHTWEMEKKDSLGLAPWINSRKCLEIILWRRNSNINKWYFLEDLVMTEQIKTVSNWHQTSG